MLPGGPGEFLNSRPVRILISIAGLAALTFTARRYVPVNPTTMGFAYLLLVLIVASTWGFIESCILSLAATLAFNFFFLPPVGNFTIADPQNWIALFAFLATSLIASRLSAEAKRRASDAIERQKDIERLYTLSRSILLIKSSEPFAAELIRKVADIFQLSAASLFDRRTGLLHRAGQSSLENMDAPLREVALHDTFKADLQSDCVLTAVRLGSEPIASLALQGGRMTDSVLQGIANLVAIGLERARAQDLAQQIEAAKQSEQLRTTLIDAMAHEFKTPLTSIKAMTTALLADPDQARGNQMELLKIADEEAERLKELIDDTVSMARLDNSTIEINPELSDITETIQEVIHSLKTELEGRNLEFEQKPQSLLAAFDRRLMKLAIRQLIDNAIKYSPSGTPLEIAVQQQDNTIVVAVTDHGEGIPIQEQSRIFERFFRSPSVLHQIPGSGLGLSIAHSILRAHHGDLTVTSHPGNTTFCLTLPAKQSGERS